MEPRTALAELEIIFHNKLTQIKTEQVEGTGVVNFGELDKAMSILERITKLQVELGQEDVERAKSLAKAQRLPNIPRVPRKLRSVS
jgi:hypothetical protein